MDDSEYKAPPVLGTALGVAAAAIVGIPSFAVALFFSGNVVTPCGQSPDCNYGAELATNLAIALAFTAIAGFGVKFAIDAIMTGFGWLLKLGR